MLAQNLLLVLGSVFAAIFFFFVYKIDEFGHGAGRIILFYAGPLLLSIACFYFAAARGRRALGAATGLLCLLVAAYGGELLLSYLNLLRWRALWTSEDQRSLLEVARDLENRGRDAWPTYAAYRVVDAQIAGRDSELITLGGVAEATTVFCAHGGDHVVYESDRYGFFNPSEAYELGRPDIMVVGDSFIHGHCVDADAGIVPQLRKSFPASLNFGMSGNGPLLELATLREYGPYLEPRVVVWGYFAGNDLMDLDKEKQLAALRRYLDPDYRRGMPERRNELDRRLRAHLRNYLGDTTFHESAAPEQRWKAAVFPQIERDQLLRLLSLANLWRFVGLPYGAAGYDYDLLERVLRRARDEVASWGGQMVFLYLPYPKDLIGLGRWTSGWDYRRGRVLDIARELNLPVVDMHPMIVAEGGPLAVADTVGSHYNADGYAMVATALVEFLGQGELRDVGLDRAR